MIRRRLAASGLVGFLVALAVVSPATPASAHPLGNATVNHYDGLHLYPDHLTDFAVEDIAEIPTLQRKGLIDTNHDGAISPTEASAYAASQCEALAASDQISVNGQRVHLTVGASNYSQRPGAIQLFIGRLTCDLSAPAALDHPAHLAITDNWDGAGIGWHEITATATDVTLHNSPFPANSISDELLHYPNNLLSSPIDVRSGTVAASPGAGASTYAVEKRIPAAGPFLRALNHIANVFNGLVGRKHVTVGAGLLALVLAMVLGAGHALLPGHGKTIMAAYLVGRRGRVRDVAAVGATVTITHTAGVLILGGLISASTAFAPTEAEQDLAIVSGLMVVFIGLSLMVSAFRRRRTPSQWDGLAAITTTDPVTMTTDSLSLVGAAAAGAIASTTSTASTSEALETGSHRHTAHEHAPHDHGAHDHGAHDHGAHDHGAHEHGAHGHSHEPAIHDHDHGPQDHATHDHGHSHDLGGHDHASQRHSHGFGRAHSHGPSTDKAYSRSGLIGLGMAGGLVPSPSALLVLLATIALGRTIFGVVLVLGYGLGMALTLCVAGLLLVRLRGRLATLATGTRVARVEWVVGAMPVLTSLLVLLVGVWLTLRAVGGTV